MIVVDASVLANAVGDDERSGEQARDLLRAHRDLAAPDLIDVETTAVFRRRWLSGTMTATRFRQAIDDLSQIPISRYPTKLFMRRAYELRQNVTAYDACYVALAEALDWTLWTGDRRLAHSSGPRCAIRLLADTG